MNIAQVDASPISRLLEGPLGDSIAILIVIWAVVTFFVPFCVFSIMRSARKSHEELLKIRKALVPRDNKGPTSGPPPKEPIPW